MILTNEPIEKILYDGIASHTVLGQKFIELAAGRLGIDIEACYHRSGLQLLIPPKKTIESLVRKGNAEFIRSDILTVWCHSA